MIHSTRDYAVTFQRRSPGCKIRVRGRESRSRLFRSSCSRRSREIASGHYGRLLTASPPATSTLSCLLFYLAFSSFGSVRFSFFPPTHCGPTLTNLFQFPSYLNSSSPSFLSTSRTGQVLLWYAVCTSGVYVLRVAPHHHVYRSTDRLHTLFTEGTLTDDRTGPPSVSPPLESRGAADRPRQPRRPSFLTFLCVSSAPRKLE